MAILRRTDKQLKILRHFFQLTLAIALLAAGSGTSVLAGNPYNIPQPPAAAAASTSPLWVPLLSGNELADSHQVPEISRYGESYRFQENGWVYIHIEGDPYERGFQHGYLVAPELADALASAKHMTLHQTGMEWDFFVRIATRLWADRLDREFLTEMKGIAAGAREAGTDVSWQEVLAWNGYEELLHYWWPHGEYPYDRPTTSTAPQVSNDDDEHCSAFVAAGSATEVHDIVMAHNSWFPYVTGQHYNIIMDIEPSNGNRILMQSGPGFIDSFTDFFVTSGGLMGTETTHGGFIHYDSYGDPEFYRARNAMQYATDLDQFVDIMLDGNNGGYANAWLLADQNTGEIMRFEIGLDYFSVERKMDGYFIGFNAPTDPQIRNLECYNSGYFDVRTSAGARRVRLSQLMEEHYGQINVEIAQNILADHYDVYLQQANNPCSRTVEGHYELDPMQYWMARVPYQPSGAVDGKVLTSTLAKGLGFSARWGSSSGMPFDAQDFLASHPQYSYLDGYLQDRPSQPWTMFGADKSPTQITPGLTRAE